MSKHVCVQANRQSSCCNPPALPNSSCSQMDFRSLDFHSLVNVGASLAFDRSVDTATFVFADDVHEVATADEVDRRVDAATFVFADEVREFATADEVDEVATHAHATDIDAQVAPDEAEVSRLLYDEQRDAAACTSKKRLPSTSRPALRTPTCRRTLARRRLAITCRRTLARRRLARSTTWRTIPTRCRRCRMEISGKNFAHAVGRSPRSSRGARAAARRTKDTNHSPSSSPRGCPRRRQQQCWFHQGHIHGSSRRGFG